MTVSRDVPDTIEIEGLALEVAELPGDPGRRPLVLLHEGLGSVGLWRGFPAAPHAATGRRVILSSRFGHGASAPPATKRTPAFFGDEALRVLPALLDAFDASEPILVGHSDGASIALVHAADRPTTAAVLMAPHVVVEDIALEAIRRTRAAFLHDGLRERLARHHDDPDVTFWSWNDMWLDATFEEQWSLEPECRRLAVPTLLIQGAEDPYGTLEQLDRIQAAAPGPVTRLVLPCGHSPHLEQPEAVLEALVAFLAPLP